MESLVTTAKESQSKKGKQEKELKPMTDDILRVIKERQQMTLRNATECMKSRRTSEISASKQITNGLIGKNRINI